MNPAVIETCTELRDVPAPGKLNLFLHIVGRRPDGYHLLQSVFMLIDWCDTLHFKLRTDGAIHRIDALPGTTLPAHDLIVRAAHALQAASGCALGAEITLEKRLPAEAGMGGGSSDAASTLLALNRLWDLRLSRQQLAEIGLKLGADVPFFIGGHNAWVEGVGEQLTPVVLPPGRFVVVKPPSGASTAAIFGSPVLKRDTKPATLLGFAADAKRYPDQIWAYGANDLQAVAQIVCPEISDCIVWLARKGLQARMTGSGSAVFAPWVESVDLSDAPPGWQIKICSNWAEHPLRAWCEG